MQLFSLLCQIQEYLYTKQYLESILFIFCVSVIQILGLFSTKLLIQSRNKIMSESQALRTQILQQSDGYGSKQRFGLFSSPISTALGDDAAYKTKLHPRNQQGKPITELRGVFTNPPRSGQLAKSFFSGINSLAAGEIKDQYVDPDKKRLQIENETFKNGFTKEAMFKPASGFKELHIPPYQYKEENNPQKQPKRNRDPDGKVKVEPRNYYTNLQSTVIKSYFKHPKYIEDPFERAHQLEVQRAKREKSLQGQAKFKLNIHPQDHFQKDKKVFGTDVSFSEKKTKEPELNIYKHENRWKVANPNKSGIYGFFSPFPPYKQSPPKETIRKPKAQTTKDQFRRMSVASSKPSPSIAYSRQNVLRTISHSVSFRH